MKTILILKLLILLGISVPAREKQDVFPAIKGWEKTDEIQVYDAGNLFDYINGAADAFLSYDFTGLRVKEYIKDNGAMIKAEVYDQGDEKNAFGIYSIERSPEYDFLNIGGQAYQVGDNLNMNCGRYYVKLLGYSLNENDKSSLISLAKALSVNLDKNAGLPSVLEKFPGKNKQADTEMYISNNFLGFGFLRNAFTADYKENDLSFQLFLIQGGSAGECREMLEKYIDFSKQDKEIVKEDFIRITDRYNGDVHILWDGKNIFGTVGCEDGDSCNEYLTLFKNKLNQ